MAGSSQRKPDAMDQDIITGAPGRHWHALDDGRVQCDLYRAVQIQATGAEETPATGAVAGRCSFPPKSQTAQALTACRAFGSSAL